MHALVTLLLAVSGARLPDAAAAAGPGETPFRVNERGTLQRLTSSNRKSLSGNSKVRSSAREALLGSLLCFHVTGLLGA